MIIRTTISPCQCALQIEFITFSHHKFLSHFFNVPDERRRSSSIFILLNTITQSCNDAATWKKTIVFKSNRQSQSISISTLVFRLTGSSSSSSNELISNRFDFARSSRFDCGVGSLWNIHSCFAFFFLSSNYLRNLSDKLILYRRSWVCQITCTFSLNCRTRSYFYEFIQTNNHSYCVSLSDWDSGSSI